MKIYSLIAISMLISLPGCWTPPSPFMPKTKLSRQTEYLKEASGKASQDEIAQHFGTPNGTYNLKSGGQVWTYDDCYGGGGSFSCLKFVLTFDEKGILRNAVRQ